MKSFCQRSILRRYYYHSYNSKTVSEPCLRSLRSCKSAATPRKSMQPLLILLCRAGKEGTSGLKWLGEGQTTELEICESAEGSAAPRAPAVRNIYRVRRGPSFADSKGLSQGYGQRERRPSSKTLGAFCLGNHLQNCRLKFVSDFTQKYWHICCYDKAKKQSSCVIPHESRN